jgi:hypothetical protein
MLFWVLFWVFRFSWRGVLVLGFDENVKVQTLGWCKLGEEKVGEKEELTI